MVQHEAHTPAGWVGDWLVEAGCELDVRRPYAEEPLPADLEEHAGLLVLGGSMDSWDDAAAPWLPTTRELVRHASSRRIPVLGICLGHQLAALALGGEVGRNPAGATVAVLPMGWTDRSGDDPLLGAVGAPGRGAHHAVHWNDDVVLRLPHGAHALALSPDSAVQAARLAPTVWGTQCHPEVGTAILEAWLELDEAELVARGVDVEAYRKEVRRREAELVRSWRPLGTAFAALCRTAARQPTTIR